MDGAGVCVAWMIFMSRKRRNEGLARRRLARAQRRIFAQRQAQQRSFFTLVLSMIAFNLCSPTYG